MFCWLVNVGYIILVCSRFVYQVPWSSQVIHCEERPPGRLPETTTEEVLEVQRSTAPGTTISTNLGPLGAEARGRTSGTSADGWIAIPKDPGPVDGY